MIRKIIKERICFNFRKAKIIGLGEATHGTSEFHHIRSEIIQYMVQNQDLRLIVLEEDFFTCLLLNKFLRGGSTKLKSFFPLLYRVWRVKEFGDILEWIRSWNTKNPSDIVSIVGCDTQFFSLSKKNWDAILDLLQENSPLKALYKKIKPLKNYSQIVHTPEEDIWEMEPKKRSKIYGPVKLVIIKILKELMQIKQKSGKNVYYLVTAIERLCKSLLSWILCYTAKKDFQEKWDNIDTTRDKFMLQTFRDCIKMFPSRKVIFYAHNGHVNPSVETVTIGTSLKSLYGMKYYSVLLAFKEGKFTALDLEKRKPAVFKSKYVFPLEKNLSKRDRFFFVPVTKDILYKKIKSIGAGWKNDIKDYPYDLVNSDGLIFINSTNPSTPV